MCRLCLGLRVVLFFFSLACVFPPLADGKIAPKSAMLPVHHRHWASGNKFSDFRQQILTNLLRDSSGLIHILVLVIVPCTKNLQESNVPQEHLRISRLRRCDVWSDRARGCLCWGCDPSHHGRCCSQVKLLGSLSSDLLGSCQLLGPLWALQRLAFVKTTSFEMWIMLLPTFGINSMLYFCCPKSLEESKDWLLESDFFPLGRLSSECRSFGLSWH